MAVSESVSDETIERERKRKTVGWRQIHSGIMIRTFGKGRDTWRESASVVTVSGSSFPLSDSNHTADVITSAVDMRSVSSVFRSPAMIASASEKMIDYIHK
jgi:hypothetical protein